MDIITILREPRILGFVIFDWSLTILSAVYIAKIFHLGFFITLLILLIISIFLHYKLNVNTRTNYYLGLNK